MIVIEANSDTLISVLLGYNQDAGWRGQGNIVAIRIPFREWNIFNTRYLSIRSSIDAIDEKNFMWDIATSQYNELRCSAAKNKEATLLLPGSEKEPTYTSDLIEASKKLPTSSLEKSEDFLLSRLEVYYKRFNPDAVFRKHLDRSTLSEWNNSILSLALTYQLLSELINVEWR